MNTKNRLSEAYHSLFDGTAVDHAFRDPPSKSEKPRIQCYPSESTPDLAQGAIYLGAFPQSSLVDRLRNAVDYTDSGTYSETTILSVLEGALAYRQAGQKIPIVFVGRLKELCNGGPLFDLDDHKKRVIALGKMHFSLKEEDFDFHSIEDFYPDFFQKLSPAKNSDVLSLLSHSIPDGWGLERIAHDLYMACSQTPELRERIQDLMPRDLRGQVDPNQINSTEAYGIFEAALHIAELLQGRTHHFGVERQYVYNRLVIDLLKGLNGPFKDVPSLHALFAHLAEKNPQFVGVNFPKNSPVSHRIRRTRARLRLTSEVGGAVAVLGAVFFAGRVWEQHASAALQESFEQRMFEIQHDQACHGEDRWMGILTDSEKMRRFQLGLLEVRNVFFIRYQMQWSDREWEKEILPDFLDHLTQEVNGYGYNGFCAFIVEGHVEDMVDRFVQTRNLKWTSKGYNVTEPYAYMDLKEDALAPSTPTGYFCYSDAPIHTGVQTIGFVDDPLSNENLAVYRVSSLGNTFLANENGEGCLDSKKIPDILSDYRYEVRRATLLPYWFHDRDMSAAASSLRNLRVPLELDEKDHDYETHLHLVDPFGEYDFEAVFHYVYDSGKHVLLDRKPGESHFSSKTALEMLEIMEWLRFPSISTVSPLPTTNQTGSQTSDKTLDSGSATQ